MSEDFKRDIRDIAEKALGGAVLSPSSGGSNAESEKKFLEVLDEFFRISLEGVQTLNECLKEERLAVHRLPADFLDIFLGIPGRRAGISLVSSHKLVVFFDEDPDIITVIGKIHTDNSNMQVNINKSLQLIKISFVASDKGYIYKENTGRALEPEDVIALIIRWLVSG